MAALCTPPLTSSSITIQSRTTLPALQSNHYPHARLFYKPSLGLLQPLKIHTSFKSMCAVKDPTVETSDEDEEGSLGMNSLLQLYKEAVQNEDDKTASDIEATVRHLENEKNKILDQITSLSGEISSGKEKYIRLQADFDNYRKRSEKERVNVRSNAQGEVMESLLPIIDNFERAKQQLKIETEQEKKIDASYQGIYKQFVEIMRSLKVAAVPTVGKPFDPSVHEAIAREESHEFEEGIVIEEFRRGFLLGERLLRPAMVKVSAGRRTSQESADQFSKEAQTIDK